jgi:isoamylase
VAMSVDGSQTDREPDRDFYIACSAWPEPVPVRIPLSPTGRPWRRAVDTALPSPLDIVGPDEGMPIKVGTVYKMAPFSSLVLISEATR